MRFYLSFIVLLGLYFAAKGNDTILTIPSYGKIIDEPDNQNKIEILLNDADRLRNTDIKQSTHFYRYAFDLAGLEHDTLMQRLTAFRLAENFHRMPNYGLALKYYKVYGDLSALLNDSLEIGVSLHYQADVNYYIGEYKESEKFYWKAITLFEKMGRYLNAGACYNNLGLLYDKAEPEKAMQFYRKAFNIEKSLGKIEDTEVYLNNMGCILMRKDSLIRSKQLLDSALYFAEQKGGYFSLFLIYGSLGEYYQKIYDLNKAEEMYLKSIDYFYRKPLSGDVQSIIKLLISLYEQRKDFSKAYRYLKIYESNRDSLELINNQRIFLKQEFEEEMKLMEESHAQLQIEQDRRELLYRVYVLSSMALLIFLGLFWRFSKKSEQKRRALALENQKLQGKLLEEQIENQNKELTSKAIILAEKNELIRTVSNKLNACKPKLKKSNVDEIQGIITELNLSLNDRQWEEFENSFNYLYPNFYKKLLEEFTDLTPAELRMCSFLKLNMSTKDIAKITHTSEKSVEVSRSRLRKKLNLSNVNTSLFVFFSQY